MTEVEKMKKKQRLLKEIISDLLRKESKPVVQENVHSGIRESVIKC